MAIQMRDPYRSELARSLIAQGINPGPIQHPNQTLGALAQALVGGLMLKKENQAAQSQSAALAQALSSDPRIANDPVLSGLIENPQFQGPIAGALVQGKLTPPEQQETFEILTPEQKTTLGLNPETNYQRSSLTGKISALGTGSGVTVNTGDQPDFWKELQEGTAKNFFEQKAAAEDAAASLRTNAEAQRLLNEGIISGFGAEVKLGIGKMLQSVGVNLAPDAIANTEAFLGAVGANVGRAIKLFGAGSGLSDADREFAMKMAAGDIAINDESMAKLFDINNRASRAIIKGYNTKADQVMSSERAKGLPFDLRVPLPELSTPELTPGQIIVQDGARFQVQPDGSVVPL